MILVSGANGRVGANVVAGLVAAGVRPRVLVRDEAGARARFGTAVEIFVGDLADEMSVGRAMAGIDAVFLCSPVHPDQVMWQGHVVSAAISEGAYIVKLSGLATFPGSFVDSGRWHADTEAGIRASGLAYTFLHPWFFAQNLAYLLKSAARHGVIESAVPTAAIAMVDVADIAAVAVRLLLDPSIAPFEVLPLTGPRAVTYTEVAALLSTELKQPVRFAPITLTQLEENLVRTGQPAWHRQILLQFNRAFNEGLGSTVHPSVHRVLGRKPASLPTSLAAMHTAAVSGTAPFA